MTKSEIATIVLSGVLILSGCTRITVTKLELKSDNTEIKGQRFSLPKPYIQVTPKEDGSILAEIVYLPDPEHTYAVNSFSVFANDTLEVTTEAGIAKTINWTGDSSAVVQEAIGSAGTVASGILQAEQTKKADQKAKEDTASKAVDDAQLELDIAQSTLAIHIANNAQEKIIEAKLAVQAAAIKLSAAQAALARVRGTATSNKQFWEKENAAGKAVDNALQELQNAQTALENIEANKDASKDVLKRAQLAVNAATLKLRNAQAQLAKVAGQVFGPKLFAIRDEIRKSANDKTTPFLEIITVEQHVETPEIGWNPPQPKYPVKWPDAPKPPKVRIFPEGMKSVPDQSNSKVLTLQASVPLVKLVLSKTRFEKTGEPNLELPPISLGSPTVIEVDLRNVTTPGDYTLHLAYQTREHEDPSEVDDGPVPVNIKILR